MIIIAGHLLVNADDRDRYVTAHQDLIERARASRGCVDLAITADPVDPRRVNNVEIWESSEALDAFRAVANVPNHGISVVAGSMRRYDATDEGPPF
jgi:quinol monooxygenase YgiN